MRERGAKNISPLGKICPNPGGGGVFRPREMPLGGEQIRAARPAVRGNHIEGALAPQAAGQRKWPRLGRSSKDARVTLGTCSSLLLCLTAGVAGAIDALARRRGSPLATGIRLNIDGRPRPERRCKQKQNAGRRGAAEIFTASPPWHATGEFELTQWAHAEISFHRAVGPGK